MANEMMVKELEQVVVRFSGDSGDGMQLMRQHLLYSFGYGGQ